MNTLGTIVCTTEDVDDGLVLIGEALAMARENGDALEQMRGYWNLFANSFSAARWEDALVRFREAADALPRLGQGHLVPELQVTAADCLVRLGRWDEAERMVEDARRRQRAGEEPIRLPDLDIARGRFAAARDYLEGQRHRAAGGEQGARRLAANQPRRDRPVGGSPRRRARAGRRGPRHRRRTRTNPSRPRTSARSASARKRIARTSHACGSGTTIEMTRSQVGSGLLERCIAKCSRGRGPPTDGNERSEPWGCSARPKRPGCSGGLTPRRGPGRWMPGRRSPCRTPPRTAGGGMPKRCSARGSRAARPDRVLERRRTTRP